MEKDHSKGKIHWESNFLKHASKKAEWNPKYFMCGHWGSYSAHDWPYKSNTGACQWPAISHCLGLGEQRAYWVPGIYLWMCLISIPLACHVPVRVWVHHGPKGAWDGSWAEDLGWTGWQTRGWHRPPGTVLTFSKADAPWFTMRPGVLSHLWGQTKPYTPQSRDPGKRQPGGHILVSCCSHSVEHPVICVLFHFNYWQWKGVRKFQCKTSRLGAFMKIQKSW